MLVCSKSITKQIQWNLSLKQSGWDHYTTFTETYICCALSYKNSLYWVYAASHKHFSQSEVPITQALQPIRGCQAANHRLPITLALQPIRGCQSLMHFSQSEAANHSSTSASQRLPITQELSQSEASYHSSISAIRLRITFVLQPIRLSITQVLQPIRTSHTLFCMKSPKSGYHDCLTSQSTAAEPQAG